MAASPDRVLSLDGVKVLLVDDNAEVREVVTLLLEAFGATVTAVPGVAEALEALERERSHVLISDIQMPGENGYALLRKVRALPPELGGRTPAVALTGLAGAEDQASALRAGFQYHMAKPVDAERLAAIVAALAANSAAHHVN